MKICGCGCGQLCKTERAIYVAGHHRIGKHWSKRVKKKMSTSGKITHNTLQAKKNHSKASKGRKWSEESKKLIGKIMKEIQSRPSVKRKNSEARKGRKLSLECRKKISKSLKGKNKANDEGHRRQALKITGRTKENNEGKRIQSLKMKQKFASGELIAVHKGKHLSLEHRNKIGKSLKRVFGTIEGKEILYNRPVLPYKFSNTSIEIKIQNLLKQKNIKFETQKKIFGRPDLFIEPNICVFCDGDYWHNIEKTKKRDKEVNLFLVKNNYIVLRFWEKEINNNIEKCYAKIKNNLLK